MGRLTQNLTLTVGLLAVAPILLLLALFWTAIATVRALMEVWK